MGLKPCNGIWLKFSGADFRSLCVAAHSLSERSRLNFDIVLCLSARLKGGVSG